MAIFSWLTQKLNGVESVVDSSKIKFSSNMSETESVYDEISDLKSDLQTTIHSYTIPNSSADGIGSNHIYSIGTISNNGKKPLLVSLITTDGADNFAITFYEGITMGETSVNFHNVNAKKLMSFSGNCHFDIQILWRG